MVPTILREVPGAAAYFGTYHSIKRNVLSAMEDGGSAPSPWRLVVIVGAGGVAGAVYALASHPQDVIKVGSSVGWKGGRKRADGLSGWVGACVRLYRSILSSSRCSEGHRRHGLLYFGRS